jgi:hypothetical protein
VARCRRLSCVRHRLEHVRLVLRLTGIGLPHKTHLKTYPVLSSNTLLKTYACAFALCSRMNLLSISP